MYCISKNRYVPGTELIQTEITTAGIHGGPFQALGYMCFLICFSEELHEIGSVAISTSQVKG